MPTQRNETTRTQRRVCPICQKSSQAIDDDYIDRSRLQLLLNKVFAEEGAKCALKWRHGQWIISSAPRCLESVRPRVLQLRFCLATPASMKNPNLVFPYGRKSSLNCETVEPRLKTSAEPGVCCQRIQISFRSC